MGVVLYLFRPDVYEGEVRPRFSRFLAGDEGLGALFDSAAATRWWERADELYPGAHQDTLNSYGEVLEASRELAQGDRQARDAFLRTQSGLVVGPLCVPNYGAVDSGWSEDRAVAAFAPWLEQVDSELRALVTMQRPLTGALLEYGIGEATHLLSTEEVAEADDRLGRAAAAAPPAALAREIALMQGIVSACRSSDDLAVALCVE